MRRYLPPLAAIAGAYALNRFCLLPAASGLLHRFLAWYFADILAGALMLLVLDALLELRGRPPVRRVLPASAYLLGCGLFWEVVTPLYLPRSVSDPWDLAAYWAGGMAWLLLGRCFRTK